MTTRNTQPWLLTGAMALAMSLLAPVYADTTINTIVDTLAPLEVVANHGGIRRSIDLKVEFQSGKATLLPDGERQLTMLGEAMLQPRLQNYRFQVIGHTDAVGTEEYNLTLSKQRAQAAAAFLNAKAGVLMERLDVIGKGESQHKPGLAPDEGANRRVEIVAIPVVQAPPAPSLLVTQPQAKDTPENDQDMLKSGESTSITW